MIVVVPVDPPRDGLVLSTLAERTPLSASEARRLYEATATDVLRAVASSGGDLLVNYRDEETLPAGYDDADPEDEVRSLVEDALGADALETDPSTEKPTGESGVRLERQVGSTRSARIGNTVTHLLERESTASVGVLEPTAPLVARTDIDGVAMALRRNDVVLGPALEGRTYFNAFAEPIDFESAYAGVELSRVATRSADAGFDIGFAETHPTVAAESGLATTIGVLEAQQSAGRVTAAATAQAVDVLGLEVGTDGRVGRQ